MTNAYSTFAYVSQPAKVAPAGEAWAAYGNRNALFSGDGSHATAMGTYLTAVGMPIIEHHGFIVYQEIIIFLRS